MLTSFNVDSVWDQDKQAGAAPCNAPPAGAFVGMTDVLERATEMRADGGLVTPAVGAPPPAPTTR